MGVSVIPSYLGNFGAFQVPSGMEGLGRDLAALGSGIGHVIDPYMDFHTKLRETLASNPELMERFADFRSQNPEAYAQMSRMLPPDIRSAAESTKPSLKSVEEAALRPAMQKISGMKEGELPKEMTAAELGAYRRLAGGEPGQAAMARLRGDQANDARAYLGTLDPEVRQHIAALDLDSGLRMYEEMAFREKMLNERDKDRVKDYAQELALRSASHMAEQYGGTPEEWGTYLHDAGRQQRARDMASGKLTPVSQQDSRDMEMEQYRTLPLRQRELNLQRGDLAMRAVRQKSIEHIMDRINGTGKYPPADEDMQRELIPALQEEMDQQYGPGKFRVGVQPRGKFLGVHPYGSKVQITDEHGNALDPGSLHGMQTNWSQVDPNAIGMRLGGNPRAREAWIRIVQSGNIERGLESLYQQEVSQGKTPLQNSLWMEIMNAARTGAAPAR